MPEEMFRLAGSSRATTDWGITAEGSREFKSDK